MTDSIAGATDTTYGKTVEAGVITIRVPEAWVLFDQNGVAEGWYRGDSHWDVFTPDAAHALFSKGRQLQHERLIGYTVRGMSHDAAFALMPQRGDA